MKDKPFQGQMPLEMLTDTIHFISGLANGVLETNPTDVHRSFVFSVIAKILSDMNEDEWNKFKTITPCGNPGCDCHNTMTMLIPGLTKLRDEYRKPQMTHNSQN
jgi:hypothetical protein